MRSKRRRQAEPRSPRHAPAPLGEPRNDILSRWTILALAGLTWFLSLGLFAPVSAWPLGFVVFVPWLIAVCAGRHGGWIYLVSYLLGAAFFLTHWQWLFITTPLGYIAGSLWCALYFPLAAWPVRHFYRRGEKMKSAAAGSAGAKRLGGSIWHWSPVIVFPVVWTATELVRSRAPMGGFPWFLLGHSQINLLPMIQIADMAGVYGVSFALAVANGWLAALLLHRLRLRAPGQPAPREHEPQAAEPAPSRVPWIAAGIAILVPAGAFVYGTVRLWDLRTSTSEGLVVSVIQGDFIMSPDYDPTEPTDHEKRTIYLNLLNQAALDAPDLIVLPETPWHMYLNREFRELNPHNQVVRVNREQNEEFQVFAESVRAGLVVGSMSLEPQPPGSYPEYHRYNSAFVYTPGADEPARYDKVHLVPFGEVVPFRYNRWLHPVYLWLNSLTPWGQDGSEYSLTPGSEFRTFAVSGTGAGALASAEAADQEYSGGADSDDADDRGAGARAYAFAVTICYEDVVPQVFRRFVVDAEGRKQVDFMVNISNDGWFGRSSQQPQHLVNCAFRAVENRVGIARAVNTGVSGFIRPDGSWYDVIGGTDQRPAAGGIDHRTARITTTDHLTFYSRYGDVFAWGCLLITLMAMADAVAHRRRAARPRGSESA